MNRYIHTIYNLLSEAYISLYEQLNKLMVDIESFDDGFTYVVRHIKDTEEGIESNTVVCSNYIHASHVAAALVKDPSIRDYTTIFTNNYDVTALNKDRLEHTNVYYVANIYKLDYNDSSIYSKLLVRAKSNDIISDKPIDI